MSCLFKFEDADVVWRSGDRKETKHMKIEKVHEDGTVETYRISKIEGTKPNEVFFKHPRTDAMETIHVHLAPITGRSSPHYYEVRQSFHQAKPCSDALGGFCSGQIWDLPVSDERFSEVLKDFCNKGYKQVPYIVKQQ